MEEEAKKTRPGKGKNKAGESEVVAGVVAPVELEVDQQQVELQRCYDSSLLSEGPAVGDKMLWVDTDTDTDTRQWR